MPVWIDTHCHLDAPEFTPDVDAVRAAARAVGVQHLVIPAVELAHCGAVQALAQRHGDSYALGIHPLYTGRAGDGDVAALGKIVERVRHDPHLVAVGEIGLDYFLPALDRERQQSLFEAQLQLAADFRLPALLHVRRSHAQVIATLKRFKLQRVGIIHAFAGSREEAREYIKLGFKLGLGGAATWPQALRLRRVLADLPLDTVVLETDSPDMAPVMFANQRNSPEHLPAICEALAGVMNISAQRLAQASTANACSVFEW